MKIVLFSTGFYEYMISFANALAAKAEVVLILPSNRLSEKHKDIISSEVTFEPFELVDYKSLRQNYKMIMSIVSVINKHPPDTVHIQSNGHRWFWLAYPFLRKYPIFNTVHDIKMVQSSASAVLVCPVKQAQTPGQSRVGAGGARLIR